MRPPWWDRYALVAIVMGLAGCSALGLGRKSLYVRLQSEDDQVRIAAAVEAGRTGDRGAAAYLVELLADDAPAVRLFAVEALRRITGQALGYRWYADEASRRGAIGRWRRWLEASVAGEDPG
ncbi:MAG: HEAT repeat domain-containing protein [Planctomycetota bacterium]